LAPGRWHATHRSPVGTVGFGQDELTSVPDDDLPAITARLDFYADTGRSYRYKERAPKGRASLGDVYLKAWAVGNEPSDTIEVTVRLGG